MPFQIDEQRLGGKPFQRDGVEVKPQLEVQIPGEINRTGTLPVISIPHYEFPRVVYKHPVEPFEEIEHRNDRFEVVGIEVVPTTHLTKTISCAAHEKGGPAACEFCQKALERALDDGWVLEPYIPKPLPDRRARLYDGKKAKKGA